MSRSSSGRSPGRLVCVAVAVLLGADWSSSRGWRQPRHGPGAQHRGAGLDIEFGQSDLKRETRVEQSPDRTKITLDSTVLFAKDSATINRKALGRIQDVGEQLKVRGPGQVRITGYTDDLGSAAYGKSLSKRRAAAVATLLRDELPAGDYPFTIVGLGEDDPAVPNTSEKNRKVNRRVVVVYQKS